jgi:hypothetical protein
MTIFGKNEQNLTPAKVKTNEVHAWKNFWEKEYNNKNNNLKNF